MKLDKVIDNVSSCKFILINNVDLMNLIELLKPQVEVIEQYKKMSRTSLTDYRARGRRIVMCKTLYLSLFLLKRKHFLKKENIWRKF